MQLIACYRSSSLVAIAMLDQVSKRRSSMDEGGDELGSTGAKLFSSATAPAPFNPFDDPFQLDAASISRAKAHSRLDAQESAGGRAPLATPTAVATRAAQPGSRRKRLPSFLERNENPFEISRVVLDILLIVSEI